MGRKGFNTCMLDVLEGYEPETAGANAPDRKTRIVAALKNVIYPFDAIRKAKIAVGWDRSPRVHESRRGRALRGVVVLPHLHFLHRKHPPRASRIQKYSWQRHGGLHRRSFVAVCARANGTRGRNRQQDGVISSHQ